MSNIEEDIMSEEAFNELIDNFEVVETLTDYGRKAIKQNVKKLKTRIQELEEENRMQRKQIMSAYNRGWIPKQKVKDVLTEIQKEYEKLDKASDDFLNNKEKTAEDYVLEKERLATMQTLAYCRDNLEELLEEK